MAWNDNVVYKNFVLEKGTNLKFGARPLRRAIQRYIEDEISEKILRSEVIDGQTIKIDFKEMAAEAINGTLKEKLFRLEKDRLDFGFDSIYFRYAEVVDELSWLKLKEERSNGNCNFDRKHWADAKKMHFYNCLEQLLRAHEEK